MRRRFKRYWIERILEQSTQVLKAFFSGWRIRKMDSPLHFHLWLLCQWWLAVAYHIIQLATSQTPVKPTEKITMNTLGLELWVLVMNILSSFCSSHSQGRNGFKRQAGDPDGLWHHLSCHAQQNHLITWVLKSCKTCCFHGLHLGANVSLSFRSSLTLHFVWSAFCCSTFWCI